MYFQQQLQMLNEGVGGAQIEARRKFKILFGIVYKFLGRPAIYIYIHWLYVLSFIASKWKVIERTKGIPLHFITVMRPAS